MVKPKKGGVIDYKASHTEFHMYESLLVDSKEDWVGDKIQFCS